MLNKMPMEQANLNQQEVQKLNEVLKAVADANNYIFGEEKTSLLLQTLLLAAKLSFLSYNEPLALATLKRAREIALEFYRDNSDKLVGFLDSYKTLIYTFLPEEKGQYHECVEMLDVCLESRRKLKEAFPQIEEGKKDSQLMILGMKKTLLEKAGRYSEYLELRRKWTAMYLESLKTERELVKIL